MPNTKTTRLSELMERSRKKSFNKPEEKYTEINGFTHNSPNQNGISSKKASR